MSNLAYDHHDEEQYWESDKYTVMDELAYQSGIDTAPVKEKSQDIVYMEHVDKLEQSRTTEAMLERVDMVAKYMTEDELHEGQMPGVSNKMLKHGEVSESKPVKERYIQPTSYSDDDSDDLFSDDDDDIARELETIRMKRIAELQAQQKSSFVTSIKEIQPESFEDEVKVASKHGFVFMLVYRDNHTGSTILKNHLTRIARKYPSRKFTQMLASSQIRNFPLEDCPVLMIYKDSNVAKQYRGLDAFGGSKCTPLDVEWKLAQAGFIETDLMEDPRDSALFNE